MSEAPGVERAFHDLADAPPALQGLLRPVLVRALQDPVLMRLLGTAALTEHLAAVGQLLTHPASDRSDSPGSAPNAFVHLAVGEDIEDVEDAYVFARSLDAQLRARVESGLSRVLQNAATRSGQGRLSLLALARLLALAFSNVPFVAHMLEGGAIEPFLPTSVAKEPHKRAQIEGAAMDVNPGGASELASFVGQIVELVATVTEDDTAPSGHVFVTIGRVLGVSAGHVLLETLRGDEGQGQGSQLLIGMAHIVAMRTVPQDSLDRISQVG